MFHRQKMQNFDDNVDDDEESSAKIIQKSTSTHFLNGY